MCPNFTYQGFRIGYSSFKKNEAFIYYFMNILRKILPSENNMFHLYCLGWMIMSPSDHFYDYNIAWYSLIILSMMTSSNGNIFRATGLLCGEFTGHRWIPLTKASDAKLRFFMICAWTNGCVNNRYSGDLRRHHAHYDVTVMKSLQFIVRRAGLLWSQQDFEWRWSVPLFKCLTVLEFSFILFDLCLLITFVNFTMNYVPIVTFWIFTYHKIWILSIIFCFIWSYWIIYFLACLEVYWRVVS